MNYALKWTMVCNALLLLLITHSKTVFGLSCYVCNSQTDSGCETSVDPRYRQNCIEDHYKAVSTRCIKSVLQLDRPNQVGSSIRVVRRCGWAEWSSLDGEKSCRTDTNENGEELTCICKDNFCNGSSPFSANHMFTILALTLLLCFSLY